ncbi:serine protease [Streptomyces sp. CA-111067]|uniref:serine protease n=1 Tax=Streptomyces sp. CA-111067 TaxID=3240046 RepID=UPI003D973191
MAARVTGPDQALVRVCDLAGRPRGSGFLADTEGTMITSHEAVDGLARLVLHAPGDQICLVEAAAITVLPEAGLALVATEGLTLPPLPVAPGGPAHPGGRVRLRLPGPAEGAVIGTAAVTYTATDRFHLLEEVYELSLDSPDPNGIPPQASGAPVFDAATGAVLAVLATALHAGHRAAGFAVPLRAQDAPPPLADLLARNAATVPAYGPHLNLAGALQLTGTSVGTAAGPGPWREPVSRPEVAAALGDFLDLRGPSAPLVLGLVGEPGSGRSTELAALAARRARGPLPQPTVWLRGAELRPGDGGIKDAVERALRTAARIVGAARSPYEAEGPAVGAGDPTDAVAELAGAAGRPLLVLLDGPEEMPPVLAHALADWTAGTVSWLRAGGVRLIVACRPEHWEQAGALLPAGFAYGVPSGGRPLPPCLRLGDLTEDQASGARIRYGLAPAALAPVDAAHPLAMRLLSEVRAALPEGGAAHGGGPPTREEIFGAHLDLVCLRIAVRLAAGREPPLRGTAVRRLAARVAGQVHEAARRCLGPGQGELDREAFEELFPWRTGWASAVLTEGLIAPAGAGYRFAQEELADWLQGLHLDLHEALYALIHRWSPLPTLAPAPTANGLAGPSPAGRIVADRAVPRAPFGAQPVSPPGSPDAEWPGAPGYSGGAGNCAAGPDRGCGPEATSGGWAGGSWPGVSEDTGFCQTCVRAGGACPGHPGGAGNCAAGPDRGCGPEATSGGWAGGPWPGASGDAGCQMCGVAGCPGHPGGAGNCAAGPDRGHGPEATASGLAGGSPAGRAGANREAGLPGEAPVRLPSKASARAGQPPPVPPAPAIGPASSPRSLPVPRHRAAPVVQALLHCAHRPETLAHHLTALVEALDHEPTAPSPPDARRADAVWWAAHLVREVLTRVSDAEAYWPVLCGLADRVAARAVACGGFDPQALGGLGEFGPRFWQSLPLPPAHRLELLRALLPADPPPPARDRFLDAVVGVLREVPGKAVAVLCGWFGDDRALQAGPGAGRPMTVASAAQAVLHTHRRLAVDDLTEALVDAAHPAADDVLAALAEDEPSALCRAVDRWAHDPRPDRHVAAATYGRRAAPFIRSEADRELLRYAALAILARPGDCSLHGAALGLLVRDPATRSRHLPAALAHFATGDPQLPASALAEAMSTHPEQVLAAFGRRLRTAGSAAVELLPELAEITDPALSRRVAALVQDHVLRRPESAPAAARFIDLRLEQGPSVRAVLLPLTAALLHDHPAPVRRALAPVLAAPGTHLSRPLRQELLDMALAAERDQEVLHALLTAAADGCRRRPPVLTRDLVHRLGLLLGRTPEGATRFDGRIVALATASPDFARMVADWVGRDGDPAWDAVIGPSARHRLHSASGTWSTGNTGTAGAIETAGATGTAGTTRTAGRTAIAENTGTTATGTTPQPRLETAHTP